jgi:hypothetical protein
MRPVPAILARKVSAVLWSSHARRRLARSQRRPVALSVPRCQFRVGQPGAIQLVAQADPAGAHVVLAGKDLELASACSSGSSSSSCSETQLGTVVAADLFGDNVRCALETDANKPWTMPS